MNRIALKTPISNTTKEVEGKCNFEMIKICPIDNESIEAIILTWLNMNCPLIVRCKLEVMNGNKCPKKRKYTCVFPLNPERREAVG